MASKITVMIVDDSALARPAAYANLCRLTPGAAQPPAPASRFGA